jgi:hypothetical protein
MSCHHEKLLKHAGRLMAAASIFTIGLRSGRIAAYFRDNHHEACYETSVLADRTSFPPKR